MPLPKDPGGDDLTAQGKSKSAQDSNPNQYGTGMSRPNPVAPPAPKKPAKAAPKKAPAKAPVKAPAGAGGVSAADWTLVRQVAARYKIDPYILVAIGIHETGWGTLGDGRNGNILGVGSYDSGSTYQYAGLQNQLEGAAKILQRNGVHTIADIAAGKLAPAGGKVKYASDPNWSSSVVNVYNSVSGTKFTGTVSTAAAASGGAPASAQPDPGVSIDSYGFISAVAKSEPELQKLMGEFAGQDLGSTAVQARLEARIKDTQWYKTHTDGERQQEVLKATDPASYQRKYAAAQRQMMDAATGEGVALNPESLARLTKHYLAEGWSTQQVNQFLVNFGKANGAGSLQTQTEALKTAAAQWMVPVSPASLAKWAQQITTQVLSPDDFTTYLKEQAKSLFPALAASIDRGVTVEQYADPYRNHAAGLLEIDPQSIDFMKDPKYQRALFQVDPKTKDRTVMSLADWDTYLRGLPEYAKTAQANQQAAGMATSILNTFGAVA